MPIRHLPTALLLACLLAPAMTLAAKAPSPEKKAAIEALMEVTGAGTMRTQFADGFVQQAQAMFAASNPNVPPRALAIVAQEARAVLDVRLGGERGLLAAVYPVYDRHFSLEELQAMTAFYRTPAGQKALRVLPQLTVESMQAGQQWMQSVLHALQIRVEQRLAKEGLR
jgi:hypothetical protein